jgi:hypothetical protein
MQAISDFTRYELGMDISFDPASPHYRPPFPDVPPPSRHLRKFSTGIGAWAMPHLIHKGTHIRHLLIDGGKIIGQYKLKNGFLLFVTSTRDNTWFRMATKRKDLRFSGLYVYYVLSDFSGADWAVARTYWWRPEYGEIGDHTEFEPPPIVSDFQIVNDSTLDFYVSGGTKFLPQGSLPFFYQIKTRGWYRLTVFDPPERFKPCTSDFRMPNTMSWMKRYFHVKRLCLNRS